MPKEKTRGMWWRDEVDEKGFYAAILNRIRFHGSVDMDTIVALTGYSISTCRKHVRRMIEDGKVERSKKFHLEWYQYKDRSRVGFMTDPG